MAGALAKTAIEGGARLTYADYKGWELKPGERYEIIYGEAYAMSAPNIFHQAILMELATQFNVYMKGKPCKVFPAPLDVRLFPKDDDSDDTVVQPDISIICDREKRATEGCRGAPDLVVEILSPSNTVSEMERKLRLYREAGVREYWVLNPEGKTLQVYALGQGAPFPRFHAATEKVAVGIFPDLVVDLEPVFAEDV